MNTKTLPVVIVGAGQSGLAAAQAVRDTGLAPLVLEASARAAGSWPHYYDSLKAFSPNRFNNLAGKPFGGDPDAYPGRDDVASYLERFAESLGVEIRTGTRVTGVSLNSGRYLIHAADGSSLEASGLVAASGSFANPYVPDFDGARRYGGRLLHVADYREPGPYRGKRVLVVGAGNSAIQVAVELARVASVTLASHYMPRLVPHLIDGRDVHYLLTDRFDDLPPSWLAHLAPGKMVTDIGGYANAFDSGLLNQRAMFTRLTDSGVVWANGEREDIDAIILATGYRPSLGYLASLGALDEHGMPLHSQGVSLTHPGLIYLGLEYQRGFASNTLRGVATDAAVLTPALAAYATGAHLRFDQ
ncbi:MAG TPA: NAD(P)-binding domain-containing protein, partial [Stackebrandtia sp.]|uniref:flavin-containing monooxygenase n=1 Tax=Stackebrandtia sp. TaxID=2023065 RepID=UPI002D283CCA